MRRSIVVAVAFLLWACSGKESRPVEDTTAGAPAAPSTGTPPIVVLFNGLDSPADTIGAILTVEDDYERMLDDYLQSLPLTQSTTGTADSAEADSWLSLFSTAATLAVNQRASFAKLATSFDSTESRRVEILAALEGAARDSVRTRLTVERAKSDLGRWTDVRQREARIKVFDQAQIDHRKALSRIISYGNSLKSLGFAAGELTATARFEIGSSMVFERMILPDIDLEGVLRYRPVATDGLPITIRAIPTSADLRTLGVSDCRSGQREVYVNKDFDRRIPPIVLAFYQYHEFAHHTLGHIACDGKRPPAIAPHLKEFAADCEAVRLMREHFGEDGIRIGFAVVGQLNGTSRGLTDTHPSDVQRALNLQKRTCGS